MDVEGRLKLTIAIAGILTVVFEYRIFRFLLGLVGIPAIATVPFLGILFLFQYLIWPVILSRNLIEVKPGDAQYGWLYDMVSSLATSSTGTWSWA